MRKLNHNDQEKRNKGGQPPIIKSKQSKPNKMKANEQQMVELLKRTLNLLNDPNADGFQAGHLQSDIATLLDIIEPQVVIGAFYGNMHNGEFQWYCPHTGVVKTAWGEFNYDAAWGFYHKVYDENDKLIYIVKEREDN